MDRREALQLLMGGAALQFASPSLFASLRTARILLDTQAPPRTLNPQQNATVTAMAETILPKTDTVGATEAGASQFVDLILTEWYNENERTIFLNGLADVNAHAIGIRKKVCRLLRRSARQNSHGTGRAIDQRCSGRAQQRLRIPRFTRETKQELLLHDA